MILFQVRILHYPMQYVLACHEQANRNAFYNKEPPSFLMAYSVLDLFLIKSSFCLKLEHKES